MVINTPCNAGTSTHAYAMTYQNQDYLLDADPAWSCHPVTVIAAVHRHKSTGMACVLRTVNLSTAMTCVPLTVVI